MSTRYRRLVGGVSAALLACAAPLAQAAPADEVKALVDQGKSQQAYELAKRNPSSLGDPIFDYYFGMAAIDAGAPGEGVLALERYLLNYPESVSGRLELGRGYYFQGDYPRAREMFEDVKKLSPPPEARNRIEQFLAAIRDKESAYKTRFSGFVESSFGRDSNVNSGIANDVINVPVFGPITLGPDGREKSDRYWGVAAGVQMNHPVSPTASVFAGLSVDNRAHSDADQFDQRNIGGAFGVTLKRAADQFRFSASASVLDVNNERYRDLKAATVEWNRSLEQQRGFSLYAQVADIAYQGDNSLRDGKLYAVGGNWRQALDMELKPFFSLGLNVARERNDHNRDDLARNLYGARAGLGVTLSPRINAAFSLSWQKSRYQAVDPFFVAQRADRYSAVELALGYMFTRELGARLEISRFDNRSNIELFEYKRNLVALKLRYDFK